MQKWCFVDGGAIVQLSKMSACIYTQITLNNDRIHTIVWMMWIVIACSAISDSMAWSIEPKCFYLREQYVTVVPGQMCYLY